MTWYVQVQNQAYGPYTDEQMHSFVTEGRITDTSLITSDPRTGYFHAKAYEYFQYWSQSVPQAQIQTDNVLDKTQIAVGGQATTSRQSNVYANPYQAAQDNQAKERQSAPSVAQQPVVPQSLSRATAPVNTAEDHNGQIANPPHHGVMVQSDAAYKVYLVMAEIRSEGAMGFLKSLQEFGIAQRIGDTVWLVRSRSGVEQMRNVLSQSLSRQDRLFILDSHESKTAWFNIGADLDSRIRELWSLDDE